MTPEGTQTYTPAPGFVGIDFFVYTITDGHGGTDSATVTINVKPADSVTILERALPEIDGVYEAELAVAVQLFVVAAIVTPPDVISQLMLAIPMCLLYEAGILAAAMLARRPAAA